MGLDMFMHGATRVNAGVDKFADTIVREFQATLLPENLVHIFGVTLPFVEALIGILLILGLFTRGTLVLAILLMAVLIFGTSLRSDWNTIGLQLLYVLIYYVLLSRIEDNSYGLDRLRQRV
jgi:thiosulfate dehydrogenase (quinone) large subunit